MAHDPESWAKPVTVLEVDDIPGAVNANIRGRRLSGVTEGFGPLWQKTFRARLSGVDAAPEHVISTWKQRYSELWPKGNEMFLPAGGIIPGGVGVINGRMPGAPTMATGVMVVYSDAQSFAFMTPQGHPFTGIITFSAASEEGATVAEVQEFVRASDPIWELGMRTFLGQKQNDIWRVTLRNLAALYGVEPEVEERIVRVDARLQWRNAKNVWYNAGVRSTLYAMGTPLRRLRRSR
ncbi:hypothetical protein BH18CHL2_BH18CHL2_11640 [soil metagenome]